MNAQEMLRRNDTHHHWCNQCGRQYFCWDAECLERGDEEIPLFRDCLDCRTDDGREGGIADGNILHN